MIVKLWTNILQDDNNSGDMSGGGGTGSGSGSLLTSFNAGSGSKGSEGGTNPPNSTTGENKSQGTSNTDTPPTSNGVKDWRMGLPTDLQEDVTLRKFSDVPSLAAAYINAQKLIGADKIAIPGKHASEDDWMGVYKKLGLPEKIDDYKIDIPESATIDENFVKQFKENSYKFGILPGQAQKLAEWFTSVNSEAENKWMTELKTKQEQEFNNLKNEWGKKFDSNLSRAQLAVKEFADADTIKYLEDTGIGNDPKIVRLLAKMGNKLFGEAAIHGGDASGATMVTKEEAKKTIDSIMASPSHPYFVKDHPGHKQAVREVQDLFAKMYAE